MIGICLLVLSLSIHAGALCSGAAPSRRCSLFEALELGILTSLSALSGAAVCRALPRPGMTSALAFALLCGQGGRLLLEALRPLEEEQISPSRGTVLACAAFFAFAAGFALPFFDVLWAGAGVSMGAGVFLAAALPPLPSSRQRIHRWACAAGGLCLTGVGVKILLDALL